VAPIGRGFGKLEEAQTKASPDAVDHAARRWMTT
jgi:hypothetical protein